MTNQSTASRLWISTRKGLFRLKQAAGGWLIDQVSFVGHPVSIAFDDPRDGTVYAALNLGHFGAKLHRSNDGGATWTEMGVPTYPVVEDGKGESLRQIWALEAAGPHAADGLWCGTIPGGLFRSMDRGETWKLNDGLWNHPLRAAWQGGGADYPALHSICVDPRDARHVLVGVSTGGAWRTRDGGDTWDHAGLGMFAEYMPPEQREDPNVQDVHLLVQCAAEPETLWVQHHNGVFKSVDGGGHWNEVVGLQPSRFGFAVAVHPADAKTAWFVPAIKDEVRVPVDARLTVTRTRDGGATCDALTRGLPQQACYDIVYRHALAIDGTGQKLAFGSTTGHVWTTNNAGDEWQELEAYLPPVYAVRFGAE